MKIAVPTSEGVLDGHFGHTRLFTFLTVNEMTKKVETTEELVPPPHEPGVLPRFIAEQGTTVILASGMGPAAVKMLESAGVEVVLGCPVSPVAEVVAQYLNGSLVSGESACDHESHHH